MHVRQVMTPHPKHLSPTASILDAADIMKDLDIGSILIVKEGQLIGIVTDRDIVVRGLAEGMDLQSDLADIMSDEMYSVRPTDDVTRAFEIMQDRKIRRLPVVDESGDLVGILSLGDLATRAQDRARSGQALEEISQAG